MGVARKPARLMSKIERTLVGVFLAGTCPLLVFVGCWWTAVILQARMPGLPVKMIPVAAICGLAFGIVLDVMLLRRWIRGFYTANLWLMAALYGALCVVAVAFFMGLPVGTFALGLVAGAYAGRRQHHAGAEGAAVSRALRRAAFLAGLLTAGAALPIGILVLGERSVVELLGRILRVTPTNVQGTTGVLVVCFLSAVLFGAQYWASLQTGWLAFTNSSKLPPATGQA